ncbi:MAG: tetratricopeptide repeat protein [Proteobacteria bacterium]|nr:tetratricopeptide repeat protein [Pseudomonadota bacterium]
MANKMNLIRQMASKGINTFLILSLILTAHVSLAETTVTHPVIYPAQVTYETEPVLSMAISSDGKWIVYTSGPETVSDLWLAATDPAESILPRQLTFDPFSESFPSFSTDGNLIAYVGTTHDVKGDIYLLDITDTQKRPVRITGRDTKDGAPVFSPDSRKLYFHQSGGYDDTEYRIVYIDLGRIKKEMKNEDTRSVNAEVVDTGILGAFPAISPKGDQIAYVSYQTSTSGNILVSDLLHQKVSDITKGDTPALFPSWSTDGKSLFYTTFPADTDKDGAITLKDKAVIVKTDPETGFSYLVTPYTYSAIKPQATESKMFFLSDKSGSNNCWSQPIDGQITLAETPEDQLKMANDMENRVPYSPTLSLLSYYSVLERFPDAKNESARAALAIGNIYRSQRMMTPAFDAYAHGVAVYPDVQPEASLSALMKESVRTEIQIGRETGSKEKTSLIKTSVSVMEALAKDASPIVQGKVAIEQAKLMMLSQDIPYIQAIAKLDHAIAITSAPQTIIAEAMLEKGNIYSRIGERDQILQVYLKIIKTYPDEKPYADMAVENAIDLYTANLSGSDLSENILFLRTLAEDNVKSSPLLTKGALNRIGDLYYHAGDLEKAKDTYTEVLTRFPGLTSQTAAARLSLAEILYREERFRRALDLYEKELSVRPFDDRIYQLARAGYIKKSISAGEYLFRIGEIQPAAKTFKELIDYDAGIVEAHRGYIKCAYASGNIEKVIASYDADVKKFPDDPVYLYSAGLSLTYRNTKPDLLKARGLIKQALKRNGQIEYFHQTLGYIDEVRETAYGDKNTLENALISYKKAYFLNNHQENPDNAANLLLNMGNASFNLERYQQAWPFYAKRLAMGKPFDNIETEIQFYLKLGQSAYYVGKNKEAADAFHTALDLIDARLSKDHISDIFAEKFDKLYRFGMDTVITPALTMPTLEKKATPLFNRMAGLNTSLFQCLQAPASPTDDSWKAFLNAIIAVKKDQEQVAKDLTSLFKEMKDTTDSGISLTVADVSDTFASFLIQLEDMIKFPDRYITLKTEILNRLALALQEDGNHKDAFDLFETVYGLNKKLGLDTNLSVTRRNVAYNKYLFAGSLSGDPRTAMLKSAADDFKSAIALVDQYGVPAEKTGKKGGVFSIKTGVAVNDASATQAAFGFSAPQEKRLAEAFLTRIHMELGELEPAVTEIEKQLKNYPPDQEISANDIHGVSLLYHNAGLLAAAREEFTDASSYFKTASRLCLAMATPVSSAINIANMARTINILDKTEADPARRAMDTEDVFRMDKDASKLVSNNIDYLDPVMIAGWHNRMGVYIMPVPIGRPETADETITRMIHLKTAAIHFLAGIDILEKKAAIQDRKELALAASLYLNMAEPARLLGETEKSAEYLKKALIAANFGMLPQLEWRALAGQNALEEAFKTLQEVTFIDAGCGPSEIINAFSGMAANRVQDGQIEDGFNLAEKIAEIERFNRTAFILNAISPIQKKLILTTYGRLLTIKDFERQISEAEGEEKILLTEELKRERTLFSDKAGKDLENMPDVIKSLNRRDDQENLIILLGLLLHADMMADQMIKTAGLNLPDILKKNNDLKNGFTKNGLKALSNDRALIISKYREFLNACALKRQKGVFTDYLTLCMPEPFEAIDIMEYLTENGGLLRLFKTHIPDKPYIAFTLSTDEVTGKFVDSLASFTCPDNIAYIASEDLSRLPTTGNPAFALSGTHLLKSITNRKPFKKNILSLPQPPFVSPETGFVWIKNDESDKGAQTLLLTDKVMHTLSMPVREGDIPFEMMAVSSPEGSVINLPLKLADMPDLSLAMLTKETDRDTAYLIGHMFVIFGCPTVILSEKTMPEESFLTSFLNTYKETSAIDALSKANENETAKGLSKNWRLLGYRGMTTEETVTFAREKFEAYIKDGRQFFSDGKFADARIQFENAISIAREVDAYNAYLPALVTFARESSWQEGDIVKAETFARELVSLISASKPDSEEHADALLRHGLILSRLEKYDEAIPLMDEALEIISNLEIDDKRREVLTNLAIVLEDASQYSTALDRFQSAAMLSETMGKKELLADQYDNIGRIYDLRLSNYPKAISYYEKALDIRNETKDRKKTAEALLNIGRCQRLTGNFKEADTLYDKGYALVKDDPSLTEIQAKIIIEKANNAWFQARYQEAFTFQRDAYRISRENNLPLMEIISLNTEGLIWWTLGENEKALASLNTALQAAKNFKKREDEIATTLNNIGLVLRETGELKDALDTFDKALEIDTRIQSRWAIAYDLRNKGLTLLKMKKPADAVPFFEQALSESMAIGNKINAAKALLGLAEALSDTGKIEKALTTYEQAFDLSSAMAIKETMWRALYGLARLKLMIGSEENAKDAEKRLYQAIDIIEGMRADIRIDQLKDSFIENKLSVYETLIKHLADTGKEIEALDVAERSRARNFIDLLGNQRLNLSNALDQKLYDRQTLLKNRIETQERMMAGTDNPEDKKYYQDTLDQLNRDYENLMLEIRVQNPQLASLVSVEPLKAEKILSLIDPGVCLLSYYLLPDEVFCWIMSPQKNLSQSIRLVRVSAGKTELGRDIFSYRRTIQNLEPFSEESIKLYGILMAPVLDTIKKMGIKPKYLGIIPHGPIHYLSFATLFNGESFLIEEYPLFYLPSGSVLQFTKARRKNDKNTEVLAIGNPDLGNPALDLPFSEHEVETIRWNFPKITILTRDNAKESWVDENIHRFGIIHIASHGEFDPVNPLFSAIKLAKDKTYDGNLEASEIFSLDIRADLVILSACQTGLGKITKGDDVIGLNRSFFFAGTHAVISSLWRVSDISTAILVKQFYRMYVDKNKADSLRLAILHVKQSYPHPGYWGAFNLVGDYQ